MKGFTVRRNTYKRSDEGFQDKEHLHCEHCGMTGHTMKNCFKIHGYPDWYKTLKDQKMQGTVRANLAGPLLETPLDWGSTEEPNHEDTNHTTSLNVIDLSAIIQKEITKYIKGKGSLAQALFAQTGFACI